MARVRRSGARERIERGSASSGLHRRRRNGSAGAVEREETDGPPALVSYRAADPLLEMLGWTRLGGSPTNPLGKYVWEFDRGRKP